MNTEIKNCRIQRLMAVVIIPCVLAFLTAGCELDDDSTNSVTIYPTSATLKADETNIVEFTAGGGNNSYKWSMNNDALGTLYVAATNTAIALYQSFTNAVGTNLITVRDTGGDSANARVVQE